MYKRIKHIIWDWNGTLFNDRELCVEIINNLLEEEGLKCISTNEYTNIFTFPVKAYYEKAGFNFDIHSFEELGQKWMNQYEQRKRECNLFPEAKEILEYFYNKKIPQSILSAYSIHNLEIMLNEFGIRNYFSYVKGLDNIYAASKLDLGRDLISKISLSKNSILLIGDTLHDFEVAEKIKTESILVSNGHQSKERLITTGANVIENLIELKAYFD